MNPLSFSTLKKHYSLIPLVAIVGTGMVMAGAYLVRIALFSPEVSWDKKGNPEPWNAYDRKQYKFLAVKTDYSVGPDRPEY